MGAGARDGCERHRFEWPQGLGRKTDTLEGFDRAAGWQVMSAAQLRPGQGGFDLPDLQLKLSFGFDQAVFVNNANSSQCTVLTIDQLRSSVASHRWRQCEQR